MSYRLTTARGPGTRSIAARTCTRKHVARRSQLQQRGARYYKPELGRWTSRDPIGERGGDSVYAFLENNAVNDVDLLGLTASASEFAAEELSAMLIDIQRHNLTRGATRIGNYVARVLERAISGDIFFLWWYANTTPSELPIATPYTRNLVLLPLNADEYDVLHEVSHALIDGRLERDEDEAITWIAEQVVHGLRSRAFCIEDAVKQIRSRTDAMQRSSEMMRLWRGLWQDFGTLQFGTQHNLETSEQWYGYDVSCAALARAFNDQMPADACVQFSCDENQRANGTVLIKPDRAVPTPFQ